MKTIFTLLIVCLFSYSSFAQPGTLDSSFGVAGKTTTNFGNGTSPQILKAVLQKDNKIVEVGHYNGANAQDLFGFLAVRYTDNGALDYTYGDSGKTVIQSSFTTQFSDAAIQKDDKLLLSGYGYTTLPQVYAGIIVRLNINGKPDSSFGINGEIISSENRYGEYGAIAVQADGKIVVIGAKKDSPYVTRFLDNGTLDKSFGKNGYTYIDDYFAFFTCKIQDDGKIILAGYNYQFTNRKFCLQRYLADGTLDKIFGVSGTVITNYGDDGYIHDMAFQSDGKIVVTGETTNFSPYNTHFATARYNQDGSLDSLFGNEGKSTTTFGDSACIARSIALSKDNKIIIGGYKQFATASEFAVVKLSANGIPDSSFGLNGKTYADFGYASSVSSVLLQSTGKIVAAGSSGIPPVSNCSLARFNNDDLTKKQIIIKKIKHYAATHNNADAVTLNTNISLFPNPVQNVLTIKGLSSSNNYQFIINDSKGRIVKSKQVSNSASYQINVQNLNSGVYYATVVANTNVINTLKFVKE